MNFILWDFNSSLVGAVSRRYIRRAAPVFIRHGPLLTVPQYPSLSASLSCFLSFIVSEMVSAGHPYTPSIIISFICLLTKAQFWCFICAPLPTIICLLALFIATWETILQERNWIELVSFIFFPYLFILFFLKQAWSLLYILSWSWSFNVHFNFGLFYEVTHSFIYCYFETFWSSHGHGKRNFSHASSLWT